MSQTLDSIRQRVDDALDRELDACLERLVADDAALAPVGDALRAFLAGGKRIRPVLLLLGYRAGGGRDLDAAMGPALAMELLHTCALVHDDVIDRASTRRGAPTVHRKFASAHQENEWRGRSSSFGRAVAILLGDLAFVYADAAFFRTTAAPQATITAFARFTRLREEVMAGQYLDLYSATAGISDRATAEKVATLKSGRYSVARPLEVGALLAGADDALVNGLAAFGDPIGRAFQVRDDLLGLFGDEDATGKSTSSDLAEGKRTLLIAEALARLDEASARELDALLGLPDLTDDDVGRARRLVRDADAPAIAEAYIDAALTDGFAALDALQLDEEVAELLGEMAGALGFRTR
ncbi:MAG: polyprenyl synthetase family protein [Nitriliruptoraceae bacterium]